MRHVDIAIALGISRETLEKHYEVELSIGSNQRRMEALYGLYQAAKRGNAAAVKAYLALTPEVSVPPVGVGETRPQATVPVAATPATPAGKPATVLGKKEQAQADAVTAGRGTGWDDLLTPKAPLQ